MFFNFFALFCVVVQKYRLLKKSSLVFEDVKACHHELFYFSTWGFVTTTCNENNTFEVETMHSFAFEIILTLVIRVYHVQNPSGG
jgi:hypothetical protein